MEVFARRLSGNPRVRFAYRLHQVDELLVDGGAVTGVRSTVLELPRPSPAGWRPRELVASEFEFRASAVIVASGGIVATTWT